MFPVNNLRSYVKKQEKIYQNKSKESKRKKVRAEINKIKTGNWKKSRKQINGSSKKSLSLNL